MSQLTKSVLELHVDNELWMNELKFYKDEIKILDKYLVEIAGKNNTRDTMVGLEQLQNRMLRQREVLDELMHDIRIDEDALTGNVLHVNDIQAQKMKLPDHPEARDRVITFKKLYAEFKQDLMQFIGKWM
ncbi:hypothetical protein [Flavihumibacter sp. ZG627]|uniref:hypothetical protein n=1 Tax=Flavihumibacter sp. ZG627 TaxID=1463156 RepID=UPI0005802678|nr:hypothetical protein [Flavihumibacter sp. ZG627]KIC90231.1 hypothetical protein HY58_12800 [Flavihumibacter sp. ZG627]